MSMRKKLGLMMAAGAAGCGFFAYHLAGGTSGSFDPRLLLSQNDASALTAPRRIIGFGFVSSTDAVSALRREGNPANLLVNVA